MDLPPVLNELSFQVSVTEMKKDKVSPSESILGVKFQLLTVWFSIREGAGWTNLLTSFHRFPFNQANNESPVTVVGFLAAKKSNQALLQLFQTRENESRPAESLHNKQLLQTTVSLLTAKPSMLLLSAALLKVRVIMGVLIGCLVVVVVVGGGVLGLAWCHSALGRFQVTDRRDAGAKWMEPSSLQRQWRANLGPITGVKITHNHLMQSLERWANTIWRYEVKAKLKGKAISS